MKKEEFTETELRIIRNALLSMKETIEFFRGFGGKTVKEMTIGNLILKINKFLDDI